ncbi:MAG: multicopper oxidase domain-containing protein [Gammaproteobacteria bacterium]|nr:multicopper oxidase domain-containing protein [Gammaproteobacteria bacterium]
MTMEQTNLLQFQRIAIRRATDALRASLLFWPLILLNACTSPLPPPPPLEKDISVTPTTGLVTSENGASTFFTVSLRRQPTDDVSIPIQSTNEAEGRLTKETISFSPDNWSIPQRIAVVGVDDNIADGDIRYTITVLPAVSADNSFNGADATDVILTNIDNESAPQPVTNHVLYITTGVIEISASKISGNGVASLPSWGYSTDPTEAGTSPGPIIDALVGRPLTIRVVNRHNIAHQFDIPGLFTSTQTLLPNESLQVEITPTEAGIYRYGDPDVVNRSLGLFGAIVVRPANGSKTAWNNGPAYSQERNWVIADLDETWNRNAPAVNVSRYNPNYFLINGQNGFSAKEDTATTLKGSVGETILVRIANAGQYDQSLHFHASHFKIISQNGIKVRDIREAPSVTTINVKRASTAMILFPLAQPGIYPVHVHTAQMETGNGVYLNGTATFIIAEE